MGLSALTTAMAFAAAALPDGKTQPSVAAIVSELDAADHELPIAAPSTEASESFPPIRLAQSTTAPVATQPMPQATKPSPAAPPSPPADAVSPAVEPDSQESEPASDQSDIVIVGRRRSSEDPLEDINVTAYGVAQKVDDSLVAPIAFAYEDVMPKPVRKGLSNFLHNLGEPIVFLNYLLQLKPGKAAETLGRFAINTTLGMGGLVDVAKRKPFHLPYRHNGFANTLGYYGVKPGPYFYLPLVGPTTLRDFVGDRLDLLVVPTIVGNKFRDPKIVTPIWVLKELGNRIENEDELSAIRVTQDPYVTARNYYLQKRKAEIEALHGRRVPAVEPGSPAPTTTSPEPAQEPAPPSR